MIYEWAIIFKVGIGHGREVMAPQPMDPYHCRQFEMRVAAGWQGQFDDIPIVGAVCVRRPVETASVCVITDPAPLALMEI